MLNVFEKEFKDNSAKSTVLFLGDSITADGRYIGMVKEWLRKHRPEWALELLARGVPSETVSGLSEAKHPFPRPNVLKRLEQELAAASPQVAVVCYGMNDGIYHPFSQMRFAAYQEGMRRLSEQVREAGAKIVLMTPPPFDSASFNGPLQAANAADFSYLAPYRNYDQVLQRYGNWLLSGGCPADAVIDLHAPLLEHIRRERSADADYRYGDGIHPDLSGHRVMAQIVLNELFGADPEMLLDLPEPGELAGDDAD
ncbi:SGNH/GDSL hydrolase family protein [Paenibacillus sp. NFR01]|uniref:SGNH/GDSL hydrolase family protein n=1 Tax=Paenibacillus sp. NFR01 TaxID=1566279 RepID=UPI0008D7D6C0|nr:SGNH/GDSL hydrolase family protein [Paenibacillus sp. NFR01]SET70277.1 Lysophospholipase L1 [Paenibacillus sp. NFR01]